jgi:hypothetical protein
MHRRVLCGEPNSPQHQRCPDARSEWKPWLEVRGAAIHRHRKNPEIPSQRIRDAGSVQRSYAVSAFKKNVNNRAKASRLARTS